MYYHAPLYRRLSAYSDIDFQVVFLSDAGIRPHDAGFGHPVAWDAEMLNGYRYQFLPRASRSELGGGFFEDWDSAILRCLRDIDPDVVWLHGYNNSVLFAAAIYGLVTGRRVVIREEQTLLSSRPPWKRLLKRILLPILFRRVTALCIGTLNREWFLHYGVSPSSCFLAPYAVDIGFFEQQLIAARTGDPLGHFGLQDSTPVFLCVSRLIPKKRVDLVIQAFLRLDKGCAQLLIIGSGPLEAGLRESIPAERQTEVRFAGFLSQGEIAYAYAAASCFVLFSDVDETWGLVVNEAMCAGLPVIVSDRVGAGADLVRDGWNGLRLPAGDVDRLCGALQQIVSNPSAAIVWGRRGRDLVRLWSHEDAARGVRLAFGLSPSHPLVRDL